MHGLDCSSCWFNPTIWHMLSCCFTGQQTWMCWTWRVVKSDCFLQLHRFLSFFFYPTLPFLFQLHYILNLCWLFAYIALGSINTEGGSDQSGNCFPLFLCTGSITFSSESQICGRQSLEICFKVVDRHLQFGLEVKSSKRTQELRIQNSGWSQFWEFWKTCMHGSLCYEDFVKGSNSTRWWKFCNK